ncbi:hypothetical protein ACFL50_05865 [Candidatus Latescibacterota bacterium]
MNITIKIIILCLSIITFVECDKNPTNDESDSLSDIIITFENNNENLSIESFKKIDIYGKNSDGLTFMKYIDFDSTTTVIDSIPPGDHRVTCSYKFHDTRSKYLMEIYFENNVKVEPDKTTEINLILPTNIQLIVHIGSNDGSVEGVEVSIEPESLTLITDKDGYADFGNLPITNYLITVKKNNIFLFNGYLIGNANLLIRDGLYGEIDIHVSNDFI